MATYFSIDRHCFEGTPRSKNLLFAHRKTLNQWYEQIPQES